MLETKIAPSILAGNFSCIGEEVERITASGADLVHCDVMDGNFVPPITFGAQMVESIRPHTALGLDCHLMVQHPETHIEDFARAGADIISVHVEACGKNILSVMRKIKDLGVRACAVVNPETRIEKLFDTVGEADMLLVMSVHPGWGGQKFIPATYDKLRKLRAFCIANGKDELDIEVDGGVTAENAKEIIAAGANVLVAGSAVFRATDMRGMITELRGE